MSEQVKVVEADVVSKRILSRKDIELQLIASTNEANQLAVNLEKARGVIAYLQYVLNTFDFPAVEEKKPS